MMTSRHQTGGGAMGTTARRPTGTGPAHLTPGSGKGEEIPPLAIGAVGMVLLTGEGRSANTVPAARVSPEARQGAGAGAGRGRRRRPPSAPTPWCYGGSLGRQGRQPHGK